MTQVNLVIDGVTYEISEWEDRCHDLPEIIRLAEGVARDFPRHFDDIHVNRRDLDFYLFRMRRVKTDE